MVIIAKRSIGLSGCGRVPLTVPGAEENGNIIALQTGMAEAEEMAELVGFCEGLDSEGSL